MKFIEKPDASGETLKIAYQDWGTGNPVVFIHGWPASKEMWEYQLTELPKQGIRCIAYDRRGFGMSCKPWNGYDYDTLADDLKFVLDELDLRDVTLVGFSMGGGEVARYFSRHGGARVKKVVLISSVLPYMVKTDDNPDGVDAEIFEEMMTNMQEDRPAFLETFGKQFFGVNLLSHPVSTPFLNWFGSLAHVATGRSTQECAKAFASTDFRNDVPQINVPTLIIHGDEDKTVPIEASSHRTANLLPQAQYLVYNGAPHGLFYTEKERLNQDLAEFIQM